MADLQKFEADVRTEHKTLTDAHNKLQVEAEAKWAEYEKAKANLVAFRGKFGKVIKALDAGAIRVEK